MVLILQLCLLKQRSNQLRVNQVWHNRLIITYSVLGPYNGQSVNMNTGEYGSNGYYTTNAGFRKYPSYTESFEDNGSLLRNQMGNYYSGTWVEKFKELRSSNSKWFTR